MTTEEMNDRANDLYPSLQFNKFGINPKNIGLSMEQVRKINHCLNVERKKYIKHLKYAGRIIKSHGEQLHPMI